VTDSKLEGRLLQLLGDPISPFLYGDSGYEGCIGVITPFKAVQPLTTQETAINKKLSSDWISIKQVFGCLQNIWHINVLSTNLKVGLQPIRIYYAVCILFTNINTCLHGNTVSICYGIEPLPLDQLLVQSGK
jgi:hypothetical protein